MTNEQAVAILKQPDRIGCHLIKANDEESCKYNRESIEALEMAIKALEQQHCEDCVSRQKVKDGMRKYGFHSPDMTITEFVEDELLPVTPTHDTCKNCKHCGAYLCGYTCYKGHWGKISTKGNYGGMGDFYCADFEK